MEMIRKFVAAVVVLSISDAPAGGQAQSAEPAAPGDSRRGAGESAAAGPRVRVAAHENYSRLVFDWPTRVEYEAEIDAERLVLRFAGGVSPDIAAARRTLRNVVSVTAADAAVVITVQPGAQIRHFRIGTRIVVDVHDRSAAAEAAPVERRASTAERATRPAAAPVPAPAAVAAPVAPPPVALVAAAEPASALSMGVEPPADLPDYTIPGSSAPVAVAVVPTRNLRNARPPAAPAVSAAAVPGVAAETANARAAAPAPAPVAERVAVAPTIERPAVAAPVVVAEVGRMPMQVAAGETPPAAAGAIPELHPIAAPVVVAAIAPLASAATALSLAGPQRAASDLDLPASAEPVLVAESAPIPTLVLGPVADPASGDTKEPETSVPVALAAVASAPRAAARADEVVLAQAQLPPQRPGPRTMAPLATPGFGDGGNTRNIQLAPGQAIPPLLGGPPSAGAPGAPGAPVARPPIVPIPILLDSSAGRLLQLPAPAATVLAADPRIVRVQPASPTSLFIMAVGVGRTNVIATSDDGTAIVEYDVTVAGAVAPAPGAAPPPAFGGPPARAGAPSASAVESMIRRSVRGGEGVRVTAIGTRGYVLNGLVPTAADAQRAEAIAKAMGGEEREVINSLSLLSAIQVNVRVRMAEISRTVTRELGFNWETLGTSGSNWLLGMRFGAGGLLASTLGGGGVPAGSADTPARYGARFTNGRVDINSVIDALAQDSLVSILAEPNLTAMSGEVASFLAGGEFPVPVAGSSSGGAATVTIEFKQFGVSLAFVPTVLSPERLNLRVRPEVSELTDVGSISVPLGSGVVRIPALTVRRAETTVELGSGQSFAIAGLLSRNHTLTNSGIIGLSDIPILGALFRSDRFRRQETELVIIVTPYLVRPTSDPRALQAPAERLRAATDWDRIVLRRQLARGSGVPPASAEGRRPAVDAGFIVE